MNITVCSNCSAKLKLKSRSSEGKRAKCPKCQRAFVVSFDPPEDAFSDEDFFDDDFEEDDEFDESYRPQTKPKTKRKRKRRSSSLSSSDAAKVLRNIRSISILYIVFGCVFSLAGCVTISEKEGIAPIIFLLLGVSLLMGGIGVRSGKKWGAWIAKGFSCLYLFMFPVGTILGGYFLLNIDKVIDEFD